MKHETFSAFKRRILKDKEVKQHYDALGPEFALIEAIILKRRQKKYSQAAIAKKMGTKQSVISRFESGAGNPTVLFLYKMADALGVKIRFTLSK